MVKLTKTNFDTEVNRAKILGDARDVLLFDETLSGFGVRKFVSGKRTFFVKFNVGKQQRRMALGPASASRLEAVRQEAEEIIFNAKRGRDAQAEKKARARTTKVAVGGLIDRYLEVKQGEISETYFADTARYLQTHWKPLHGYAVDAVQRHDVANVLDAIAKTRGKVTADRAKAALSGFYAWAAERDSSVVPPTLHVKNRANGHSRDRVLSETELAQIWHAVADMGDYGAILKLLILTGQRRSEISDLSWSEVDFDARQIALPPERTKNHKPHLIPLAQPSLEILDAAPKRVGRDYLFGEGSKGYQGWSKSKARLDTELDLDPWTVHDIRRSVVTHLNETGIAEPHIIEAIANHISGSRAGVAGVYNRSQYALGKRRALERWGDHLLDLVAS